MGTFLPLSVFRGAAVLSAVLSNPLRRKRVSVTIDAGDANVCLIP